MNLSVQERVMRNPIIGSRIIIEQPIDMIEPAAVVGSLLFTDQPLHMAFTKDPGGFGNGFRRIAVPGIDKSWQALNEKAAIDEDRDPADPHDGGSGKKKAPGFLHTLGISERAYSQGADTP
jgi:hypothetical protein